MKTLHLSKTSSTIAVMAFVVCLANSGHASFVYLYDDAGQKLYNDVANKDVSGFTGYVGANSVTGDPVDVAVTQNADTGSGWANITPYDASGPTKPTILSQVIFTPADGDLFSAFSFHAQLLDAGDITLWVQDNQGNAPQSFTFSAPKSADSGPFGVISLDGETIKSITLQNDGFKEVKQIDFAFGQGTSIPEPSTVIAGALLLLPFGVSALRIMRRNRQT